jgi:predicted phage terminase large subunit-like protein
MITAESLSDTTLAALSPMAWAHAVTKNDPNPVLLPSTSTKADYTVIATFGLLPRKELVVLDIVRERIAGPQQLALLRSVASRWRPFKIGIESVAYQLSFVQAALQAGMPIEKLTRAPRETKETRAYTAATRYEIGMVYHPRQAKWLGEFEAELLSFPAGAHDDMCDCLSDAATVVAFSEKRESGAFGARVSVPAARGISVNL